MDDPFAVFDLPTPVADAVAPPCQDRVFSDDDLMHLIMTLLSQEDPRQVCIASGTYHACQHSP